MAETEPGESFLLNALYSTYTMDHVTMTYVNKLILGGNKPKYPFVNEVTIVETLS